LITPDLLTVTIFLLEVDHLTFCKLVIGVSAALSFRLCPRFIVAFLPCFLPVAAFVTLMDFVATAGF
jgi:hypothetical protein